MMSNKQFRQVVRFGHIIEGALIAIYIYSPWSSNPAFDALIKFVIVPLIILSGIALWQQPKILKLIRQRS